MLDPCCGSGTLLFAAACVGRPATGMELHALVADHARSNLEYAHDAAMVELNRVRAETSGCSVQLPSAAGLHLSSAIQEPHTGSRIQVHTWDALSSTLPATVGEVQCVVTNLPFGRMAVVGGVHASQLVSHEARVTLLLRRLRDLAPRHVYFSELPLGQQLLALGDARVREVCVDRRKRRFVVTADR